MMKNLLLKSLLFVLGLLVFGHVNAITFIGVTDSTAIVGEPISSQLLFTPDGEELVTGFSVYESPTGVDIDNAGVITFTPTDISDGGRVYIQAATSTGPHYYHFNMYVTDEVVCDPDIISYWNFDEIGENKIFANSANAADSAVSTQGLNSTAGMVGNGVVMDPDSIDANYMIVTDNDQYDHWTPDSGFSFAVWVYPEGKQTFPSASDQVLFNRWSDADDKFIVLGFDGSTDDLYVKWRIKTNGADSTFTFDGHDSLIIVPNQWHHLVFVHQPRPGNNFLKLFRNGVQSYGRQNGFDTDDYSMESDMSIGWYENTANDAPFAGIMDEALVFNRALDDAEVQQLYQDGMAGEPQCAPGNHAPELINSFPRDVDQNATYSVDLVAYDIDGDSPLTISTGSLPDWMERSGNTLTNISDRPNQDDVGDHSIVLSISDGTVSVERTFLVKVHDVNDDPEITSDAAPDVATEDVLYTHTFTWDDVDDDLADLTVTCTDDEVYWLNFVEGSGSGVLSGTPLDTNLINPASGTQDFTVTLTIEDDEGASVEEEVTITVTAIDDEPQINGQNYLETGEAQSIELTVATVYAAGDIDDLDGDFPGDYTLTVLPDAGYSVSGNTVTPDGKVNISVSVELSDASNTVADVIEVAVVENLRPEVDTENDTIADDYELYDYTMEVTDGDGEVVTITSVQLPESGWLSFDSTSGITATAHFTGTPADSDVGTTTIMLTFNDGRGIEYPYSFDIEVGNTNDSPVITSDISDQVWRSGDVIQISITATDVDEDQDLEFTFSPAVSGLSMETLDSRSARLSGVPDFTDDNPYNITIEVSDGIEEVTETFILSPTALGDYAQGSLLIYPIPANNTLTIEHSDIAGSATLEVLNMNGKTMIQKKLSGNGKSTLDVSSFESGMYIYRIIENEKLVTGKILIN